jgi:hypothetical protein
VWAGVAVKAEVMKSLGNTLDESITSFKTEDKLEQHSKASAVVKSVLEYTLTRHLLENFRAKPQAAVT